MRVHVETDAINRGVKVYIMEELPNGGVAFLWPVEYEEFGWTWYRHVQRDQHATDPDAEVRPAIEMNMQMWKAFTKALLETEHVRVDALDIIAETLKREQGRVDKLIDFAIAPPVQITEVRSALPH